MRQVLRIGLEGSEVNVNCPENPMRNLSEIEGLCYFCGAKPIRYRHVDFTLTFSLFFSFFVFGKS